MVRSIRIEPVLNGFVVNVGCQTVVWHTPAELGARIAEYYSNPEKVEKAYIASAVNKTLEHNPLPDGNTSGIRGLATGTAPYQTAASDVQRTNNC